MRCQPRAVLLALIAVSFVASGVEGTQQIGHGKPFTTSSRNAEPVPPYHKSAKDAEPLPRLLPASDFRDRPMVARAYKIAHEIPLVLAQQPCYCHCSEHFGHTSLLDCFASAHTAGCGICMGETFFAYKLTKEGKTPAQIRAAIIRGDWKKAGAYE